MSRSVAPITTTPFQKYDLGRPGAAENAWLPISYRKETGVGGSLMRSPAPRPSRTIIRATRNSWCWKGSSCDFDGFLFKAGDLVSFAPGTRHSSRTETGFVLAVFEVAG